MGQFIYDLIVNLMNSFLNGFIIPLMNTCCLIIPGFADIVDSLNSIFNLYVWNYLRFIVSLYNYALKCPHWLWVAIVFITTFAIGLYSFLKAVKLSYNLWCLIHGEKGTNIVKKD